MTLDRRSLIAGGVAATLFSGSPVKAQTPWEEWRDLTNYLPDQAALEALRTGRGRPPLVWEVQRIESAQKPTLNLDKYEIRISSLPTSGPGAGGAQNLYDAIRNNFGSFFDSSIAEFRPHIATDGTEWTQSSVPPLGGMHLFGIKAWGLELERGAVVLSGATNMSWRFSTVTIGSIIVGTHPVAGNREFLLQANGDGSHSFIIRAADRAYDHTPTEATVLDGAKDCWRAFQGRLVAFVNSGGGSAQALAPIVMAPAWSDAVANGLFTRA
ncbi:hypothetical protein [Ruegeria sp.]|uniref:hypothetical protein n=1 Tax=Ruegeria sp. TaxID=1879320 RepID=UPI003C7D7A75